MIWENVGKDFCYFVVETFPMTNSKIMEKLIVRLVKRKIKTKLKDKW